ncbi:hypothetical protein [Amycolatopsis pigmentata]|uniref:Uncharacterized protein n=1 Tax=Amycolatopsis pigmentata TaxID=450801 RepID=A0ABW5FPH6_9PSEU
MQVNGATKLPPYISRDADGEILRNLENDGLIIIEGDSASGKTRTAYEAVFQYTKKKKGKRIVIPKDGRTLRDAIEAGYNFKDRIIWLDDLERYLSPDGLDDSLLRVLVSHETSVRIVATIRSRQRESIGQQSSIPGVGAFATELSRFLLSFATVHLPRDLTQSELFNAYQLKDDPRIAFALDSRNEANGVVEIIAAGPASVQKWLTGAEGGNRLGAALVSAAVDFHRTGYLAPIPFSWLREACLGYISARDMSLNPDMNFDTALRWATEPIHGASACLIKADDGNLLPFDYLVDYAQSRTFLTSTTADGDTVDTTSRFSFIPGEVWHTLADNISVESPYFLACAVMASFQGHPIMEDQLVRYLEEGEIGRDYMDNGSRLVTLAYACTLVKVCIPCAFLSNELDLRILLKELKHRVDGSMGAQPRQPVDATTLLILDQIGRDKEDLSADAPLMQAISSMGVDFQLTVGDAMVVERRFDTARSWFSIAANHGSTEAKHKLEEISLKMSHHPHEA